MTVKVILKRALLGVLILVTFPFWLIGELVESDK